jgi:hypothetical protein
MLKVRQNIPWIFGDNTYVYTAIATNGGVLRETDITASLGEGATRTLRQPNRAAAGLVRRFELKTQVGRPARLRSHARRRLSARQGSPRACPREVKTHIATFASSM